MAVFLLLQTTVISLARTDRLLRKRLSCFELAPTAFAIVGDHAPKHREHSLFIDLIAFPDLNVARGLVVVALVDNTDICDIIRRDARTVSFLIFAR